jgi:integrator complex subunit 9
MYFISPIAKHSLAYSNISAEWLCASKQEKAFVAEPPFVHHSLLASKQLQVFSGVNSEFAQIYQQNRANSCIVFAGHPSCRIGEITQLIKLFDTSSRNTMICIEPDYQFNNVIAPFNFFFNTSSNTTGNGATPHMSVLNCPIDFHLNRNDILQLLQKIEPENVILPLHVAKELDMKAVQSSISGQIFTLDPLENILINNLKRKYEQAKLSDDLASEIYPKRMKGMNVARISARVHAKDGAYLLLPDAKSLTRGIEEKRTQQRMLFGDVTVERIVHSLQREGLDLHVEMKSFGVYEINIPVLKAIVTFCTEETEIDAPTKQIRDYLRKVVCGNFYIL